jgi:hypothetical protein
VPYGPDAWVPGSVHEPRQMSSKSSQGVRRAVGGDVLQGKGAARAASERKCPRCCDEYRDVVPEPGASR